ncbi:hypothetical protein [Streptomyces cylindrosporus]|uniref:Uncharacterized protein n=1 Tax=Streptomyces cylindrosporus TaxID=2927583 RepID=A0ABS9Y2H8_9ACTN|nr:hypothetical protein [Streptomyces cylindrosporus]MCI3271414.1 hypothetical protein [Streptomyces cylindrosporus]
MPERIHRPPDQPSPVVEDAHATAPQLLARAHVDYQHSQYATQEHQAQGGAGVREGVLPGGSS